MLDPAWFHHVVAKGNNGEPIVRDEIDRHAFVWRFDRIATDHEWELVGWCLLRNHAHMLVRAPEGAISSGMQELLRGHACGMNARHGRVGHLFRNRFFARQLKDDAHAASSIAYVDRNPLKHGAWVGDLAVWRESSYRAHMGLEAAPSWLRVDEALSFFARDRLLARENLAALVYSGHVPVSDTITEVQRFEEQRQHG